MGRSGRRSPCPHPSPHQGAPRLLQRLPQPSDRMAVPGSGQAPLRALRARLLRRLLRLLDPRASHGTPREAARLPGLPHSHHWEPLPPAQPAELIPCPATKLIRRCAVAALLWCDPRAGLASSPRTFGARVFLPLLSTQLDTNPSVRGLRPCPICFTGCPLWRHLTE